MTDFIYQMPCLSKYRFNSKGECLTLRTKTILSPTIRGNKTPFYRVYDDRNKEQYLKTTEVMKYICHLKQLEQFNPMVYHHFICYRPIIKHSRELKTTI